MSHAICDLATYGPHPEGRQYEHMRNLIFTIHHIFQLIHMVSQLRAVLHVSYSVLNSYHREYTHTHLYIYIYYIYLYTHLHAYYTYICGHVHGPLSLFLGPIASIAISSQFNLIQSWIGSSLVKFAGGWQSSRSFGRSPRRVLLGCLA